MIRFACPGCAAEYSVKDDKAGKSGKCPKCGTQFVIPGAEVAPPLTPPAPVPLPFVPDSGSPAEDRPLRRQKSRAYDQEEEDDEDERPSRRGRHRRRDDETQSWVAANRSTFRMTSGIMSIITAVGNLLCTLGCAVIGGGFLVASGITPPPPGGAPPALGLWQMMAGFGTVVALACAGCLFLYALFYLFAGIGAIRRKSYGRVLTILVGALSVFGVMSCVYGAFMALLQASFLAGLAYLVAGVYYTAHALSSFFATIGAGADEEFGG